MADEVRLIAKGSATTDPLGNTLRDTGGGSQFGVRFKITPKITESRVTSYVDEGLPESGGVTVYATTDNRKFTINATFVSRTQEEAQRTFLEINTLKSWLIPEDSGGGTAKPEIIKLWGYKQQFDGIPVVLSALNITWGDDVDYIDSGNAWVPIIQTASLTLIESHSTDELNPFNIEQFRQGVMPGF